MRRRLLLVVSTSAEEDIKDLFSWGQEEFGRTQASRYLEAFQGALSRLCVFPELGPAWKHGSSTRTIVHGSHRIIYRVTKDAILIGRIVRQERNFSQLIQVFESEAERKS